MINVQKFGFLLIAIPAFSGCAQVKSLTPTDRADPVNFVSMYTKSLAMKYGANDIDKATTSDARFGQGLISRMENYDGLLYERDKELKEFEAFTEKKRNALALRVEELTKVSNERQLEINSMKRGQLEIQATIKSLERKRAALPKKFKEAALHDAEEKIHNEQEKAALSLDIINGDILVQEASLREDKGRLEEAKNTYNRLLLTDPVEQKRRQIRDEIIADFIAIADSNYIKFKEELLAGRVQSDTISDISELLLSTATTLVGGITAKTNLGAASTIMKGSRSTVDKNFFAQQTMRAIINAIEDGRQKDRLDILQRLKTSTTEYPLSQAISDVQQYQSRANLFGAVLEIANQTGTSSQNSASQLRPAMAGQAAGNSGGVLGSSP